jgi:hypothetical protein
MVCSNGDGDLSEIVKVGKLVIFLILLEINNSLTRCNCRYLLS